MRIAGFYDNSCTNGEGWRSVIFVSGCPHKCEGCHNPQTWDYEYGEKVDNIDYYIQRILKNKSLIDGITISGGEPFQDRNIDSLLKLVKEVKKSGLDVWCYTGYNFEYLKEHKRFNILLEEIDILIDGKFDKNQFCPNLKFRGSKNQRILNVKESLIRNNIIEIA